MGRRERRKEERRRVVQWQASIQQARRKWLGKTVQFDLGQGTGIQRGKVTSISEMGDVVVEGLPNDKGMAPDLAMSLGYVDRVLSLVNE